MLQLIGGKHVNIPLIIGFQPSKVVQDFFHPPYLESSDYLPMPLQLGEKSLQKICRAWCKKSPRRGKNNNLYKYTYNVGPPSYKLVYKPQ